MIDSKEMSSPKKLVKEKEPVRAKEMVKYFHSFIYSTITY